MSAGRPLPTWDGLAVAGTLNTVDVYTGNKSDELDGFHSFPSSKNGPLPAALLSKNGLYLAHDALCHCSAYSEIRSLGCCCHLVSWALAT